MTTPHALFILFGTSLLSPCLFSLSLYIVCFVVLLQSHWVYSTFPMQYNISKYLNSNYTITSSSHLVSFIFAVVFMNIIPNLV